jgi:hypothetical protein
MDTDFASLVFRDRLESAGLVLVRRPINVASAETTAAEILALPEGGRWRFSTLDRNGVRVRDLPMVATISLAIDALIAANPEKVAEVKEKPKAFGWWVGQAMKATGGKANPAMVNEILKARLGAG